MRIGRTLPPAAAPIYLKDIISGIKALFRGQQELHRFESELKDYFGVTDCFLLSSGKAALAFSLLTLKERHPEKYEVVVPAYVCYSVPSAVVHSGLKVVPCDLKRNTLEMDPNKLSPLLTDTTLCVIVPHLFGIPAHMSEIEKLCHKKGIIVIEDAAQVIGVRYNGTLLGTQGDIGFFSLGRGKSLSTVEGGILITKDASLGKLLRARLLRLGSYTGIDKLILLLKAMLLVVFSRPNLYWFPKSLPFLRLGETVYDPHFPLKKMCEVQAGLARNWRKKLTYFNTKRKKNAVTFLRALSKKPLSPFISNNGQPPACLRFPILVKEKAHKDHILSESDKRGLGLMHTYPDSIDGIPELAKMLNPYKHEEQPRNPTNPSHPRYPEAKRMAEHILTLPVHPFVSKKDGQRIIALFNQMKL